MSGSSCSVTIIVGHLHTVQRLFRAHSNKLQVKAYSSGAATLAVGTKQSFQKPLLFSLFHVEEITPTGVIKSLTNGFRFAHWSLPPFVNLMSKSRSLQSRGSVQRYIVPCTLLSAYLAYIIPLIYRLSIVFLTFLKVSYVIFTHSLLKRSPPFIQNQPATIPSEKTGTPASCRSRGTSDWLNFRYTTFYPRLHLQ